MYPERERAISFVTTSYMTIWSILSLQRFAAMMTSTRRLSMGTSSITTTVFPRESPRKVSMTSSTTFIVAPLAVPSWGYISFEWAPVTGSKVQAQHHHRSSRGWPCSCRKAQRWIQVTLDLPIQSSCTTDMDSNLYFHPTDSHWIDEHLLKMQAVGKEKASLCADPLFTDPAGGDFSF